MFMTQASHAKLPHTPPPTPSLGAAAAAAATNGAAPAVKPDDKQAGKPGRPPKPPRKKASEMTEEEKAAAKAERLAKARKIFIVVGDLNTDNILEFPTAAQAEKFLNGKDSPAVYSVLRGNRIGTSKKVSLR
jgi:ABC-type branched-subunit amino acid transport system substrate-binding protein